MIDKRGSAYAHLKTDTAVRASKRLRVSHSKLMLRGETPFLYLISTGKGRHAGKRAGYRAMALDCNLATICQHNLSERLYNTVDATSQQTILGLQKRYVDQGAGVMK